MYVILIEVLFLVAAVAAVPATTVCNKDNCLRAVIASTFPTRNGKADCSSYFLTTVTPVTYTSTVTVTSSPTTSIGATITNTATVTDISTDIVVDPVSLIITSTTTIVPVITKREHGYPYGSKAPVAARQITDVPSSIPSYASACSGSIRYSSACSCIGVTGSTITASMPESTVTVTATVFQTAITTDTTLATQIVDVTTTETESATVTTETVAATTTAACGEPYTAPNGDSYTTYCNQLIASTPYVYSSKNDFFECVNFCSITLGCVGATYIVAPGDPYTCFLFNEQSTLGVDMRADSAQMISSP